MRILHLDTAPFMGGAQESLWSIVSGLPDDQLVLGNEELCQRAEEQRILHQEIHAAHWRNNVGGALAFLRDCLRNKGVLRQAIGIFKPQLINLNCIRSGVLAWGTIARCGIPMVLHDRDLAFPDGALRRVAGLPRLTVIAISEDCASKWRTVISAERLHVVPNGLPVGAIAQTPPADAFREWRKEGCTIVTLVADFSEWKRHALFQSAFNIAFEANPRLRGIIKGRIRDEEGQNIYELLLDDIRRNEIQNVLRVIPDQTTALPYIAASDILVCCSTREPFGRCAVEALALGKGVVATPHGCSAELLRDSPVLVAPGETPYELAHAILQAADTPASPTRARAFAQRFAVQDMLGRLRQIYGALVP